MTLSIAKWTLNKCAALWTEIMRSIVDSTIQYTLEFDLYTPPYENMQLVTVDEIQSVTHSTSMATGKRLGFRFELDDEAK